MLLAPPLARAALAFGPPEYFALVVLGLTALAAVGSSILKGLATGVAGLLLGTVGIDPQTAPGGPEPEAGGCVAAPASLRCRRGALQPVT